MKTLKSIRRADLEAHEFPGTDAAALVVEKKIEQKELEECFRTISGAHATLSDRVRLATQSNEN